MPGSLLPDRHPPNASGRASAPGERPDFAIEAAALAAFGPGAQVCGVDEAGRGPLAGPVVAAAVVLDPNRIPAGVDDSKRLPPARRAALAAALAGNARSALGVSSVAEIDRLNILHAAMLAMRRAIAGLGGGLSLALVDGNRVPDSAGLDCELRAVVRGDRRSLSIAAASILAKTRRDEIMRGLAAEFPGYGWERNAGYPTAEHLGALRRLGATPHHRRSFAPIRALAAEDPVSGR